MAYRKQREQWVGCTPEGFQELHQIIDLLREENKELRIKAQEGLRFKAKFYRFYSRWRRLKQGTNNAAKPQVVKHSRGRHHRQDGTAYGHE